MFGKKVRTEVGVSVGGSGRAGGIVVLLHGDGAIGASIFVGARVLGVLIREANVSLELCDGTIDTSGPGYNTRDGSGDVVASLLLGVGDLSNISSVGVHSRKERSGASGSAVEVSGKKAGTVRDNGREWRAIAGAIAISPDVHRRSGTSASKLI